MLCLAHIWTMPFANHGRRSRGFTIVEILVVVAIIGVLSTLAAVSSKRAKSLAQESKAKADLKELRTAIELLEQDTGRWPDGCAPWSSANPEIDLYAAQAGLVQRPSIGDQGTGCFWTASTVALWNGPYVSVTQDPWGHDYYFDPDYTPYSNCASIADLPQQVSILSFGPNGAGVNAYDCDDIFMKLK